MAEIRPIEMGEMGKTSARLAGVLLWVAAPLVSACSSAAVVQPRPAVSRAHFDEVSPRRDRRLDGFLPWAADEPRLIIVDKTSRELVLYEDGSPLKTYPVVLGRSPGRKLFEGDRRTPSGLYQITGKRLHAKYDRFLAIGYPNESDRANYRAARSRGLIPRAPKPPVGDSVAGVGGLVGIHGTDKPDLNRLGVNWTFGCVSLTNREVEELYDLVGEGTLIVIRDELQP